MDDDVDEPDGWVTAILDPGAGYTVGSPSLASVAVTDNDTAPIVSFAKPETRVDHLLGAEESVDLLINLSQPAKQPLSIDFSGYHSGSVTVPAGALSATIVVPLKDDHPAGTRQGTNILLDHGDGYEVSSTQYNHDLLIIYVEKRYASCEEAMRSDPTFCGCRGSADENGNRIGVTPEKCVPKPLLDPRCPYNVYMADGGSGSTYPRRLLTQVSAVGTLCATANAGVSPTVLDKVSRMSSSMLQHRPDLVARGLATPPGTQYSGGDIIVLYSEDEDWCNDFPDIYADQFGCATVFFPPAGGYYPGGIIMCPENDLSVCVHEIAHAIYFALIFSAYGEVVNGREPVIDRFAEPDVANLWSGYALKNHWEFFAEMSAIYFCVGTGQTSPNIQCADALRAYDPKTYEVIHGIYRGSADLR